MRYGLLLVPLVLFACGSTPEPLPPEPPANPYATVPPRPADMPVKTLTVMPLTVKRARIADPETVQALDAALRTVLAGTERYELVDGDADLILATTLGECRIREVGAGSAFTMRDLGLDPGPEFAVADVALSVVLKLEGRDVRESVTRRFKAGDDTPGLTREDLDGDGRLEMHITPEGVAALLAPALEELAARIVKHTDAAFAPPEPEPIPEPEEGE